MIKSKRLRQNLQKWKLTVSAAFCVDLPRAVRALTNDSDILFFFFAPTASIFFQDGSSEPLNCVKLEQNNPKVPA